MMRVLLPLVILSLLAPGAAAQETVAGTPQRVGRGAYPDLAVAYDGRLFLVYVRDGKLRYRMRPAGAEEWTDEENTTLPAGMVHRSDPEIVLDGQGELHVLVGSSYARRDPRRNGDSEFSPWRTRLSTFVRDTDLAVSLKGRVYLIHRGGHHGGFLGLLTIPGDDEPFEALPDPDASAGFGPGRNNHVYGDLAVSPVDDSLHIVYRHGTPRKVAYRTSMDGGKTWTGGGITDEESEGPAVTVAADGTVYVVAGTGRVFRRTGGPGDWTDLGKAFAAESRDLPQIVVDRAGTIHVAAFGGNYNRYAEGQWGAPQRLPSPDGQPIGYVDLTLNAKDDVWAAYEAGSELSREEPSGESDLSVLKLK